MDMEDANKYEIDSPIKTKEIKDYAPYSWGFLFAGWLVDLGMLFNLHLHALFFITISFSQVYQNGDYVKSLSGNICGNDGLEWSLKTNGLSNLIFISSFATW